MQSASGPNMPPAPCGAPLLSDRLDKPASGEQRRATLVSFCQPSESSNELGGRKMVLEKIEPGMRTVGQRKTQEPYPCPTPVYSSLGLPPNEVDESSRL